MVEKARGKRNKTAPQTYTGEGETVDPAAAIRTSEETAVPSLPLGLLRGCAYSYPCNCATRCGYRYKVSLVLHDPVAAPWYMYEDSQPRFRDGEVESRDKGLQYS
jgi:hypothetical protein